eukprot:CAMPEP_0204118152 /NCGR_PEP_ID=MMETSP0361-20130328/6377_1 /ASSEMBLY_ACC=CAM_ASM_000343 /TAXON_ID=268821 /ORGANISM="Scrippsiella Hangoei, Strain SHTV-5" /LENGTH=204 /DNA_ID=CAMNT_0051069129 /DNA_START=375 /DNA_END=987 /DNA_ORIENTATION=-
MSAEAGRTRVRASPRSWRRQRLQQGTLVPADVDPRALQAQRILAPVGHLWSDVLVDWQRPLLPKDRLLLLLGAKGSPAAAVLSPTAEHSPPEPGARRASQVGSAYVLGVVVALVAELDALSPSEPSQTEVLERTGGVVSAARRFSPAIAVSVAGLPATWRLGNWTLRPSLGLARAMAGGAEVSSAAESEPRAALATRERLGQTS